MKIFFQRNSDKLCEIRLDPGKNQAGIDVNILEEVLEITYLEILLGIIGGTAETTHVGIHRTIPREIPGRIPDRVS